MFEGLFCCVGIFADFGEGGFATGSGILLEEAFFDGFVVFGLGLSHVFGNRVVLKGSKRSFDVFFDLLIVDGTFFSLACCLFCGFDNRH